MVRVMVIKSILAQLCFSFNSLHKMLRNAYKISITDLPENAKINRCWYSDLMTQVFITDISECS